MGMSTHIIAFRPPDEKWQRMKLILDTCKQAEVQPPREVMEFFNDEEPESEGVKIEIREAVEEWNDDDMQDGFQVNLDKLPPDIKFIRFYNSY